MAVEFLCLMEHEKAQLNLAALVIHYWIQFNVCRGTVPLHHHAS
jgi:hypothetical protein